MCIILLPACNELFNELIDADLVLLILFTDLVTLLLHLICPLLNDCGELLRLVLLLVELDLLKLLSQRVALLIVDVHNGIVFFHLLGELVDFQDLLPSLGDCLVTDTITLLAEAVHIHLVKDQITQVLLV